MTFAKSCSTLPPGPVDLFFLCPVLTPIQALPPYPLAFCSSSENNNDTTNLHSGLRRWGPSRTWVKGSGAGPGGPPWGVLGNRMGSTLRSWKGKNSGATVKATAGLASNLKGVHECSRPMWGGVRRVMGCWSPSMHTTVVLGRWE